MKHAHLLVRGLPHDARSMATRLQALAVDLAKGGLWKCFACNIGGGVIDYEQQMFPSKSLDDCWADIYRITGAAPAKRLGKAIARGPVVATYLYCDPSGVLLFEKQRHEPKHFSQRAPNGRRWMGVVA